MSIHDIIIGDMFPGEAVTGPDGITVFNPSVSGGFQMGASGEVVIPFAKSHAEQVVLHDCVNGTSGVLSFQGGCVQISNDGGASSQQLEAATPIYFNAYNSANSAGFTGATTIAFDTTRVNTRPDIFVMGGGEVTCNASGTLDVFFTVNLDGSNNNRSSSRSWLEIDGTEVPGTRTYAYHRIALAAEDSASMRAFVPVASGQVLRVRSQRISGATTLSTLADACHINLQLINQGPGPQPVVTERTIHKTINNPTVGQQVTLGVMPNRATINAVYAILVGTTPTCIFNINHASTRNEVAPNEVFASNTTADSVSTPGVFDRGFDIPSIDPGDVVWLDIVNVIGTVQEFTVSLAFTETI